MIEEGILYWITGLSGAGKTTIGKKLYIELRKTKSNIVLLDGDIMKEIVSDTVEYSADDRKKRAMKYAKMCKMLTDQGIIVICCTISMYDDVREWNRKNNKNYMEIFLDVSLEVLEARDQKGMYSKQRGGSFKNLVGIDMQAEFPKSPDLVLINDGRYTVEQCVNKILSNKIWEIT